MLRTAAAAACGLLITYAVAVLTPLGQQLDISIMVLIADAASDRRWAQLLLDQESAATMAALTAILTALVASVRGARSACAVALTAVGTVLSAEALKAVLARPALLSDTAANSLPSGHVAAVAGLAVAAVLAATGSLRTAVATLGLAAVGLTGLATVALGWHRPSDVLAATLLAVTVGTLLHTVTTTSADSVTRATRSRPPQRSPRARRHERRSPELDGNPRTDQVQDSPPAPLDPTGTGQGLQGDCPRQRAMVMSRPTPDRDPI
jgi:membrane-associated phospholipid phosphatase